MNSSSGVSGSVPPIRPPATAPRIDAGAIHANSRQLMRPARMWTVAAVAAAIAEIARFTPVPEAALDAASSVAGRRMLPSTRPTRPPARATVKHQMANRTSSTERHTAGIDSLFEPDPPSGQGPPDLPPDAPLAARMRPQSLDEVAGQDHLLGEGSALRTALEQGVPHSMILFGPPGTGKTTLARLVAQHADHAFEELSAVQAGRAEVREVMARAQERRRGGRGTVFFLDEIHRFNKAQQDALLPAVEEGLVVLVGATTENPYFEVNSALISRTRVYELKALTDDDVQALLRRALDGGECGEVRVDDEVLAFLAAR